MSERTEKIYSAVKYERTDLYRRVVEVGHMATAEFGGKDEVKRAAAVEATVMEIVAEALGVRP